MQKVTNIAIGNFDQLIHLIQNEKFNLHDIRYIDSYHTLEIPYNRIFHDGPARSVRNMLFYKVVEVDILQCLLKIKSVESYEIEDKADIGTYTFGSTSYDAKSKQLVIACNEPCELRVKVIEVSIENDILGYEGTAKIKRGLFQRSKGIEVPA